MDKKRFEKIMEMWSAQERNSSPELFPKEEMYHRLKEKKKKTRNWILSPFGWSVVATAAAVALIFVIFFPEFSKRSLPPDSPSVSPQKGEAADEVAARHALAEPEEMEKLEEGKSDRVFNQLYFQQQNLADKSILGIDIQAQKKGEHLVAAAENYRLQIQLNSESYVYIFQVTADQKLNQLFPNALYNSEQNPLQSGPLYNIPAPPQWLTANEDIQGGTLYIIATEHPQENWDSLLSRFRARGNKSQEQESVQLLLDQLESLSSNPVPGMEVYTYVLPQR